MCDRAPEFDMSELESLFSAAAPNSDHGSAGGKSNRRVSGAKSEKVQLVSVYLYLYGAYYSSFHFIDSKLCFYILPKLA